MTYDDAGFRAMFPEFADTTKYPEPILEGYWDVALEFTDGVDWICNVLNGKTLTFAINYLAAHLMSLGIAAGKAASKGNVGGSNSGFTTSSTIGEVSVAKLAPPATDGWQWWLAQTPYGATLWAFLEVKAVGGLSVGGLPERNGFRKVGGVFL